MKRSEPDMHPKSNRKKCGPVGGVLTNFSQLKKTMVGPGGDNRVESRESSAAELKRRREDADSEAVLAYFSRSGGSTPQRQRSAPRVDTAKDRAAELEAALQVKDAALEVLAVEKAMADQRIADLERLLAAEREAREAAARERDRLQGECGRLSDDLRKSAEKAGKKDEPPAKVEPTGPTHGLLVENGAMAEAFPGEVREQILAALADAQAAARQSGRERRADVLASVLAVNQPTGELERRRAELKQILKDAGYFNDPKPLERLGFRLISGRTHWKLQYANVRIAMSKTPSDYRANLNTASDMSNRCF